VAFRRASSRCVCGPFASLPCVNRWHLSRSSVVLQQRIAAAVLQRCIAAAVLQQRQYCSRACVAHKSCMLAASGTIPAAAGLQQRMSAGHVWVRSHPFMLAAGSSGQLVLLLALCMYPFVENWGKSCYVSNISCLGSSVSVPNSCLGLSVLVPVYVVVPSSCVWRLVPCSCDVTHVRSFPLFNLLTLELTSMLSAGCGRLAVFGQTRGPCLWPALSPQCGSRAVFSVGCAASLRLAQPPIGLHAVVLCTVMPRGGGMLCYVMRCDGMLRLVCFLNMAQCIQRLLIIWEAWGHRYVCLHVGRCGRIACSTCGLSCCRVHSDGRHTFQRIMWPLGVLVFDCGANAPAQRRGVRAMHTQHGVSGRGMTLQATCNGRQGVLHQWCMMGLRKSPSPWGSLKRGRSSGCHYLTTCHLTTWGWGGVYCRADSSPIRGKGKGKLLLRLGAWRGVWRGFPVYGAYCTYGVWWVLPAR
jgi:hypothetical protein